MHLPTSVCERCWIKTCVRVKRILPYEKSSDLKSNSWFVLWILPMMFCLLDVQQKKNLLLCLLMVLVWVLDYLCLSNILKLDSSQTRFEIYNGRRAQVVKDPQANQHKTEQKVLFYRFCIANLEWETYVQQLLLVFWTSAKLLEYLTNCGNTDRNKYFNEETELSKKYMFIFEYYFKTKLIFTKTTVGTFLQMLKIKLYMLLLGTFSNFRYTTSSKLL